MLKLKKIQFLDENKVNLIGLILTFFIVCKYYSNTLFSGTPISKISMILTGLLAVILILNDIEKYNIYHILLFIFFTIQFLITKNVTLIYSYTLALGLMNVDFKKIMKVYTISSLVFIIIFMLANILNIRPTVFINGRNDFGFGNPNGAFVAAFLVWVSYLYLKFDNLDKKDAIFLVLFPILVYNQTQTRTGLLTIIATFILLFIFKKININNRMIKLFATLTPAILFIISIVIAYGFNDNYKLNRVLSHRPQYWHDYLSHGEYGLNLIGYRSDIREIVFTPRLPLDSGYIWGLYSSGIIAFVLIIAIYAYAIYTLCKQNKKAEVLLIMAIFIYAFAESILLDLGTNITFIFVAYALYILGDGWRKRKRQI